MTTATTPATDKQIAYIKSLIVDRGLEEARRRRNELEPQLVRAQAIEHDGQREKIAKLAQAKIDASNEVQALFAEVVVPADMSQARASRWIGLLNNHNLAVLDKILDDPRIGASLGVTVDEALYNRYK
jgi:transposase-like protein